MTEPLNPRLNAYRDDLADIRLKGQVSAARFVDGIPAVVAVPLAPLHREPDHDAFLDTEALFGERLLVFDETSGPDGEPWAWVQLDDDGYVGYTPFAALERLGEETEASLPTHRIAVPRTLLFPEPDIKRPPVADLPMGALVTAVEEAEDRNARYHLLASGGAIVQQHATALGKDVEDFVAVAERFLETPYLWGGKSALGIDCSGLVQLACQMAGIDAPRDSGDQARELGTRIAGIEALQRGDLIFWPGHVGIMVDGRRIIHANAHHMMTAIEPLNDALERLEKKGATLSAVRRLAAKVSEAGASED
ncbi:NlpC/P60 family protein [Fulvimarina endophytica]|uniref:NlpC/P60 family protein n=1 Tax=Fulvimarina endophytica TaxID=2293836 RepID=A0A371X7I6_9HYPH|nr:C40 family peptidase [Fulvimarina endophytica]RFC65151.1 NlpC/P60 family protein [Fulvimarina endophytica]